MKLACAERSDDRPAWWCGNEHLGLAECHFVVVCDIQKVKRPFDTLLEGRDFRAGSAFDFDAVEGLILLQIFDENDTHDIPRQVTFLWIT